MIRILIILNLVLFAFSVNAQLKINEMMSRNGTSFFDEDGDAPDWVELYNAGPNIESLNEYSLSQNGGNLDDWEIEWDTDIQPGEFVLIFCSGKDRYDQPELHTSFKLSDGEDLFLAKNNSQVDQLLIPNLMSDVSMGRLPDGAQGWGLSYGGSPAISNVGATPFSNVDVTQSPGVYDQPIDLSLIAAQGHEIRYTLNCEPPDENSALFSNPINIQDVSGQPNRFASIPTNPEGIADHLEWETPGPNVAKGTVVRFRSFYNGQPSSSIRTASYFVFPVGSHRYSIPILSVVSDSLSFFDYDTGIYVPGIIHDQDPDWSSPWGTGNYHQIGIDWERTAHIELFNEGGHPELAMPAGVRIHGQGSRALPQKSLRFYARGRYGKSSFDHPVFGDHSIDGRDVMVLRNMGQDFLSGVPVDVFSHEMALSMGQEYIPHKPVTVFVNGEYWGLQNLRERFDENNLAQHHDLPENEIDLIDSYYGGWSAGTNDAYWTLYDFIDENDLSDQANYNAVSGLMDIPNFTDHTLIKIFLGCYDWPGNNVKMWRPRQTGSKFRWLLIDSDRCMEEVDFNTLQHATAPNNPGWPNPFQSTLFLRKLLENDGYQDFFLQRMDSLLQTEFAPDDLSPILLDLKNQYESQFLEHQLRWHGLNNFSEFHENYARAFEFIRLRPCVLREQFNEFFSLPSNFFQYECDSSYHVGIVEPIHEPFVYPNPNNGHFRLSINGSDTESVYIRIYDLNGREVFNSVYQDFDGDEGVNSNLNSGMFVVEVDNGRFQSRFKMIVTEDR